MTKRRRKTSALGVVNLGARTGGRTVIAREVSTEAQHERSAREGRARPREYGPLLANRPAARGATLRPHTRAPHTWLSGARRAAGCQPTGSGAVPVRPGGLPEVEGGEDVALHAQEVLLVVRAVRDVDPVGAPAWWKQASSRRPSLGSRLDRRPSFEPLRGRRRQQLRQRQGRRSRERLSTALERVGGELSPWSLRRSQRGGHGKARGAELSTTCGTRARRSPRTWTR